MKFIALLFLLPRLALATDTSAASPKMVLLLQDLRALEKYMQSEQEFTKNENSDSIKQSLEKLKDHAKNMDGNLFRKEPALKINLQMFRRHTEQMHKTFAEGNKSFAFWMLRSSLQLCITCHSRTKTERELFMAPPAIGNALDRADFLFATRQFSDAEQEYKILVNDFPKNNINVADLRKALISLVVIHVRVQNDPKKALKTFATAKQLPNLPAHLKKELEAWESAAKSWQKEKKLNLDKLSADQALAKAEKILRNPSDDLLESSDPNKLIEQIRATSLLHIVLEKAKSDADKAMALHRLAMVYHQINHNLYFRFDELYLKTCITEFTHTKMAPKCLQSLEEIIRDGYSGSAGTDIPEEVEMELMQYRRLLQK